MGQPFASSGLRWNQIFPVRILLRAMRLAVSVRALVLTTLALVLTYGGWWIVGRVFQVAPEAPWNLTSSAPPSFWPWLQPHAPNVADELESWTAMPPNPNQTIVPAWRQLSAPLASSFNAQLGLGDYAYLVACGFWAIAVWALLGGAIARGAAIALARDESLNWRSVLGFSASRWLSVFGAPCIPLVGLALLAIPLAVLGLILRIPGIGFLLVGLAWPLALLVGVAMTVLGLGLLFGWPLMWATIAAEGTDAFDAVSRSYAYVYHRPLHYLFYVWQAAVLGFFGWLLVYLVAATVLTMTSWGISWGTGSEVLDTVSRAYFVSTEPAASSVESAGAALVRFWTGVVWTVAGAFSFSYLFTAATALYFVLREQVDATEVDEVFLSEAGEQYDLPPLEKDDRGVPGVGDDPPPSPPPGEGRPEG